MQLFRIKRNADRRNGRSWSGDGWQIFYPGGAGAYRNRSYFIPDAGGQRSDEGRIFTAEDGKGIYRIYSLEKMGKYLLNSRGVECKWQPTDNTKPVAMIKKRLAGNQTIIAYLRKVKAFESYVPKPAITAKQSGKIFKATGGSIRLTKNGKSIDFLFEVIRREEDWKKKLVDKMKLYYDFYENYQVMDSGFSNIPQLIIICEDDKHIAETFKEIVMNKLELPKIKLYFTTDLRQNQETLDKTLVGFKIDETTRKYKMIDIEVKLLGM